MPSASLLTDAMKVNGILVHLLCYNPLEFSNFCLDFQVSYIFCLNKIDVLRAAWVCQVSPNPLMTQRRTISPFQLDIFNEKVCFSTLGHSGRNKMECSLD